MLDKLIEDQTETDILVGIFEANSQNESIYIQKEGVSHIIPCLRQQVQKKGSEACYYSLSDFIMPADTQKTDYIGVFTVTAGKESPGLYLIHYLFLNVIRLPEGMSIYSFDAFAVSLLNFLITLLLSATVIYIIDHNDKLKLILLGKRR